MRKKIISKSRCASLPKEGAEGQVTFRKEVLDQFGVRPGDRITVELVGGRRLVVRPARPSARLQEFVGSLKKANTSALSIKEMSRIARKGWAGER